MFLLKTTLLFSLWPEVPIKNGKCIQWFSTAPKINILISRLVENQTTNWPYSVPFCWGSPLIGGLCRLAFASLCLLGEESWRKPHKSWETPPNTGHRGGFNSQKLPPSLLQFVSCGSDFLLVSVEVSALAKEILCIHISVQPESW